MMAFVSDFSCECVKTELDLFTVPPTQTSIQQEAEWVEYQPLTSILGNAPIEFSVIGSGEEYIDLSNNVMLYVRAKITRNNNTNLAEDSTSAPVNLLLHIMYNQVDISLNGTLINSSTNTYPYRCMLETLLSYGEDAKKSQLCAEFFYKDQAGNMDEVVTEEADGHAPNKGLQKRRALMTESKEFDMIGRIHGDIFFSRKVFAERSGHENKTDHTLAR